ncbi:hypothetical protein GCM10025869_23590 [Homoserinibacter gongjuensis]|uniref:Peptidase M24 domain-containing protein n=1 Tax=Homoserinibacter gongjuensis TaxID=1162968 RepID=A0ABQ6JU74_9MICO|nr:hypothetical protein GCM10025869_23590 [Homoserinibacter gongjuensis]
MKPAGRFVASVLEATRDAADVGVNLLELDALAHEMIRKAGAESCYIDYHPSFGASPFGKVICTSVNDAVLHGLPHDYRLRDGDLLSLDFAASVDGWVADSALSIVVGEADPADLDLIATTERALEAAIGAYRVGNRMGDVSAAIGDVARGAGLSVNLEFGGHGVGRTMHGDPHVSNDGRPGRACPCGPGSSWRSSRGSCTARMRSTPTRTAGPCARAMARAAPTPSTRSPSPTTARSC